MRDSNVYELEALEPEIMLADLEAEIRKVIDVNLFIREVEEEGKESVYLEACHNKALEVLKGFGS